MTTALKRQPILHYTLDLYIDNEHHPTFGEHLKCMPGTGRVVIYMVTQRYKYSVPTMKKNRRPMIDLQKNKDMF